MHIKCVVALILALTIGTAAQDRVPGGNNERLLTIEERLQRHGMQLTVPELVRGLRNTDPEVRWLAAAKLAQDDAKQAVPAIFDALASERVVLVRVNLASSLARLNDSRGFAALQDLCRDSTVAPHLVALATRYMLDLKREDETCRNALVHTLHSQADPDFLIEAVSLLRQFHDLSPEQLQDVLQELLKALVLPEPAVRLAASHALSDMGKRSAIPYLQSAIVREQDNNVRSAMEADLRRLQDQDTR